MSVDDNTTREKLLSENRKYRRIIRILGFILGAIIIFVIAMSWWHRFLFPGLNDKVQVLLNPASHHINREDLIVDFQPIREYLQNTYSIDDDVSIYFEFFNTGANININNHSRYYPASLLKLPLSMVVFKKIERGEWTRDNELVVMSTDKDDRYGDLHKLPVGTRITIQNLLEKMLIESDNTAYNILLRNLEPKEVYNIYEHLGLQDFFTTDGFISAKDYAIILRALYNQSYLDADLSEEVIKMLLRSKTPGFLDAGLPKGEMIAHKVGVQKEKNVYIDSGIVYLPGRPYMLIVMVNEKGEQESRRIMKDVSERVYMYISTFNQ